MVVSFDSTKILGHLFRIKIVLIILKFKLNLPFFALRILVGGGAQKELNIVKGSILWPLRHPLLDIY